jgi:hypothetical protein
MPATLVQHGPESDLRQQPEADEWWQDSAFLVWHSRSAGIGGNIRIGHEPNHAGGISALWFGLVTADGKRFRRNTTNALGAADQLDDGFGALDGRYRLVHDGDRLGLRVNDEGLRVNIDVEDFYPRTDFFAKEGSLSEEFASSHFETSGRVTGEVELDGERYEIDGLCHRDRSWGLRRWDTLLNHRWVCGTFGPELSFGSISWHAVDGSFARFGYVVRDGNVVLASDVDLTVTMESDGTTYRAGWGRWTLPDGEVFELDLAPIDGVLSEHHGVACVDAICEVDHDGLQGFCDLEVSTNPRGGSGPVTAALRAVHTDGVSRREESHAE